MNPTGIRRSIFCLKYLRLNKETEWLVVEDRDGSVFVQYDLFDDVFEDSTLPCVAGAGVNLRR